MILALSLLAQALVAPSPLGAIGRQALPAKGCAAYLWSAGGDRQLIAMAQADPAQIRLSIDGKRIDLARTAQDGAGPTGLGANQQYRSADVTASLALTIVMRQDLTAGAQVTNGVLTVERTGHDSIVTPIAGLIGCA